MTQKEKLKKMLSRLPKIEMEKPKEMYVQVLSGNNFCCSICKFCKYGYEDAVLAKVERMHKVIENCEMLIDVIDGRIVKIFARLNANSVHELTAFLSTDDLKGKRSLKIALANAFKKQVNEFKKDIEKHQHDLSMMQIALRYFEVKCLHSK